MKAVKGGSRFDQHCLHRLNLDFEVKLARQGYIPVPLAFFLRPLVTSARVGFP